MYAIVKTGDKQYLVGKNDKILVSKLPAKAGESLVLDQVLLLNDGGGVKLGTPVVARAQVNAKVLRHTKGDKIMVFKRKRRKDSRSLRGHRQDLTLLRITDIVVGGKSATSTAKKE